MGTFYNSFRKGGEKTTLTRKRGRHAHNAIAALYSLYTKVLAVANSRGMHTRTVTFTHSDCETHRTN